MKALFLPLSALVILLLSSCASPEFRRVQYPDGFLLITRSKGPVHVRYSGAKKTRASATAVAGQSVDYSKVEVVATNTRVIPCQEGHGFGMLVVLLGLPNGDHEVTAEITHPQFLPPDDQRGTTHRRTETVTAREGVAVWDFVWLFDEAYQRVPGKWTVRLFHRDKLIFSDTVTGIASSSPSRG
jgi:hypothetical protein